MAQHVIDASQVLVGVMGSGVGGQQLSSSFQRRGEREYQDELGNTIIQLCTIIPDGVLIFFASYGACLFTCMRHTTLLTRLFTAHWHTPHACLGTAAPGLMDGCVSRWRQSGLWSRLQAVKLGLVEPRESSQLNAVIGSFDNAITSGRGAVLLAVCRGKVSEGVDFSDARARAVIITGIPFPPARDPKVELKRKHLDKPSYLRASVDAHRLRGEPASTTAMHGPRVSTLTHLTPSALCHCRNGVVCAAGLPRCQPGGRARDPPPPRLRRHPAAR